MSIKYCRASFSQPGCHGPPSLQDCLTGFIFGVQQILPFPVGIFRPLPGNVRCGRPIMENRPQSNAFRKGNRGDAFLTIGCDGSRLGWWNRFFGIGLQLFIHQLGQCFQGFLRIRSAGRNDNAITAVDTQRGKAVEADG